MSELKSEIGRRIAMIRKEAGDSQVICAKKIQIKRGTLAAYENGTNATPDEVKKRIAETYGVSLQYLISGKQYAEEPAAAYHKSDIPGLLKKLEPTPLNEVITQKVHELLEQNRNQKDRIIELLETLNHLQSENR